MAPVTPRHARQVEKHAEAEVPGRRLLRDIRHEVRVELLASPIVVPIWWALWKLCDVLWGWK